jgi:hypothetical protein
MDYVFVVTMRVRVPAKSQSDAEAEMAMLDSEWIGYGIAHIVQVLEWEPETR